MAALWINLILVFVFSSFARYFSRQLAFNNYDVLPIKLNKWLTLLVVVTMVLVSGMRINIGDTYYYMHAYNVTEFTWEYVKENKDMGFGVLQLILKKYSEDAQILIVVTSLITNLLIITVLMKYSRLFEISTYVYITGGLFLVSMNGIRQVLAAAIIFTATKYLINGNWIAYFAIVLLGSTIHQSALILLPIYFLVRYKAWSRATIILLFASVIIAIGYNQFSELLFTAIADSQYGHYSDFHEGGANSIRVLVYSAPLIIAFLGRDKLRELFPSSDFIVNMALVGLLFMIISTQNWIFARFSIYFNLYQLILVSWIVKLFREREQRFMYFVIIFCYFLYYYYESVISLNVVYKSDFWGV